MDYTAQDASINVVRYTVSADSSATADTSTAEVILNVPKRSKCHQAGILDFGPMATCTSVSVMMNSPIVLRSSAC